jgi:hypothetical protein
MILIDEFTPNSKEIQELQDKLDELNGILYRKNIHMSRRND